jgi:hypothetical protein
MRIRLTVPKEHVDEDTLGKALEASTAVAQRQVASGSVPPLQDAIDAGQVKWTPEPKDQGFEGFDLPEDVMARGWGDCDDLAAWWAAELRESGDDPDAAPIVYQSKPSRWHAVVQRGDGSIDDPSRWAGMGKPGGPLPVTDAKAEGLHVGFRKTLSGATRARLDTPLVSGPSTVHVPAGTWVYSDAGMQNFMMTAPVAVDVSVVGDDATDSDETAWLIANNKPLPPPGEHSSDYQWYLMNKGSKPKATASVSVTAPTPPSFSASVSTSSGGKKSGKKTGAATDMGTAAGSLALPIGTFGITSQAYVAKNDVTVTGCAVLNGDDDEPGFWRPGTGLAIERAGREPYEALYRASKGAIGLLAFWGAPDYVVLRLKAITHMLSGGEEEDFEAITGCGYDDCGDFVGALAERIGASGHTVGAVSAKMSVNPSDVANIAATVVDPLGLRNLIPGLASGFFGGGGGGNANVSVTPPSVSVRAGGRACPPCPPAQSTDGDEDELFPSGGYSYSTKPFSYGEKYGYGAQGDSERDDEVVGMKKHHDQNGFRTDDVRNDDDDAPLPGYDFDEQSGLLVPVVGGPLRVIVRPVGDKRGRARDEATARQGHKVMRRQAGDFEVVIIHASDDDDDVVGRAAAKKTSSRGGSSRGGSSSGGRGGSSSSSRQAPSQDSSQEYDDGFGGYGPSQQPDYSSYMSAYQGGAPPGYGASPFPPSSMAYGPPAPLGTSPYGGAMVYDPASGLAMPYFPGDSGDPNDPNDPNSLYSRQHALYGGAVPDQWGGMAVPTAYGMAMQQQAGYMQPGQQSPGEGQQNIAAQQAANAAAMYPGVYGCDGESWDSEDEYG